MNGGISRREFLNTTASAAIGASLAGCSAHSAKGPVATAPAKRGPNETLRAGLVGCGSRGPYVGYLMHMVPNVETVAVCDLHKGRLAEAVKFTEGFAAKKPTPYADFRHLIDNKDIDVVIVATSIHWHVLPVIHACAAGKDVYLEKPVGTSIGEGRAAITAARKHDRIVQMGTQQHSWEHYIRAVEIIRSGVLGEISNVHVWDVWNQYPGFGSPPAGVAPPELDWEFYVGPSPMMPYNPNRYERHDWYFGFGGAWQLAWGVHHCDIVHWAMGMDAPTAATGSGGRFAFADDRDWPDTFNGACEYPPGPVARKGFLLSYTGRAGCDQPIMGCHHGKAFYGTNGVLVIDRHGFTIYSQQRDGKKLVDEEKMPTTTKEHEVVKGHVASFVDCVRTRKRPAADIEVGHRASNPGHLMNIAYLNGRRVRWDAARERIPGDREADAMVAKRYRKPWSLPT